MLEDKSAISFDTEKVKEIIAAELTCNTKCKN